MRGATLLVVVLAVTGVWMGARAGAADSPAPVPPAPLAQEAEDEDDGDEGEDEDDAEGGSEAPLTQHSRHGPWNLDGIDEELHPIVRALEAGQFKDALAAVKEARKLGKKEKWDSDIKKRVKYLETVSKELGAVARIRDKKRISHKDFGKVTTVLTRYRETKFAYLLCLDLQNEIRDKRGTSVIADFEPEKIRYGNLRAPTDFFQRWRAQPQMGAGVISDFRHVRQGRYARHIQVNVGQEKTVTFAVADSNWEEFTYLCFSAKIKDHTLGSIGIRIFADAGGENYWEIGCGHFKGWRDFKFRYQKEASAIKRNQHSEMDWGEVHGLRFSFWGGANQFWIDNVYVVQ